MSGKSVQTDSLILLVTPVWNDSGRLGEFGVELAKTLAASPHRVQWIIADDGSGPQERERLEALQESLKELFPSVELHFADGHRGKGAVVREAWGLREDADWLAFVDADGSLAAGELMRMFEKVGQTGRSVLGVRTKREGTLVAASFKRALAHRLFVLAVKLLLRVRCEDPQCGAKVLRGKDYRAVAGVLQEDGLAFDSELLAALTCSGFDWEELPVNWVEKGGGQVHLRRDALGMLRALFEIRRRQKAGKFSWT